MKYMHWTLMTSDISVVNKASVTLVLRLDRPKDIDAAFDHLVEIGYLSQNGKTYSLTGKDEM